MADSVVNTPLRRSGMARVLKGSQFYLHTPRSSANGMNHKPGLSFPGEAGTHLPTPKGWKAELAVGRWLAGWLVTNLHPEINVRHRELNPDTVAHLSTGPDID